jgi:acetylornithine deacetylase/succinyl-diaminopimelate desuccinylase-like protein
MVRQRHLDVVIRENARRSAVQKPVLCTQTILDMTRHRLPSPAAILAALLLASAASAQPSIPATEPSVRRALDAIRSWNEWTLDQQIQLCEIPAPPFKEAARAAELRRRLIALGYSDAKIDAVGNVLVERRGSGAGPTIMIAGHLDTVFPEGTDVKVRRSGTRLEGPGIGDDCRGLAVLLAVARALNEANVRTQGTVILVADVGEEGPGNLRGVRELFHNSYRGRVDQFISVDGLGFRVAARAVGSRRFTVVFRGPGGHSYGAFGMPSAIHAMGRAIANISDLHVPANPKTTFNVGVVKGGTSVNSIAGEAAMEVDMRSESVESLERVHEAMRDAVERGLAAENARWPSSPAKIAVRWDTIGIRPVGRVPQTDDTPIVRTALEAAKLLGATAGTDAGSTDSNLPMSLGIPAITIGGGGRGGNAHALGEWYDDGTEGYKGPQWALLIVAALAGLAGGTTP